MDAFQPKYNCIVLSFLKYFHENEFSELFGISGDLEHNKIQIKLEIYLWICQLSYSECREREKNK